MKSTVFVVSQEPECAETLKAIVDSILTEPCTIAASASQVRSISGQHKVKHLLFDRSLDTDELLELIKLGDEFSLTPFGTSDSPSDALSKIESISSHQLRHPVERKDLQRLFECLRDSAKTGTRSTKSRSSHLYRGLVGDSLAIRQLRKLIERIAVSKSNVLITGETGTGKEIVARNIHYQSRNGAGPFVPVNCSAIPADLLESELFGHRKGAFTGALSDREGRFAAAADGTLFLDEIGDMAPALQVKLLRVLEERVIYPVGCNEPIEMTCRLVSATHQNLEKAIENGSFREDLYYRLNVVPISVPSLSERIEDLPMLAKELSYRLQRDQGISIDFTANALQRLQCYNWPGNVRQLGNLVERLAVTLPNDTAHVADLPDRYRHALTTTDDQAIDSQRILSHSLTPAVLPEEGIDLKRFLQSTETTLIQQALDQSQGTMSQAARMLQVGRTTLTEKVKRLGLSDYVKAVS